MISPPSMSNVLLPAYNISNNYDWLIINNNSVFTTCMYTYETSISDKYIQIVHNNSVVCNKITIISYTRMYVIRTLLIYLRTHPYNVQTFKNINFLRQGWPTLALALEVLNLWSCFETSPHIVKRLMGYKIIANFLFYKQYRKRIYF